MRFPISQWKVSTPLELPRVGPFASRSQTFVAGLPGLNTSQDAGSTESVPLVFSSGTVAGSDFIADPNIGTGCIYLWGNVFTIDGDGNVIAPGNNGSDAIDNGDGTYSAADGASGTLGGGGSGGDNSGSSDPTGGAGGTSGSPNGQDGTGETFGFGGTGSGSQGTYADYGSLQPAGSGGGSGKFGAGGGGGATGGQIVIVVNHLITSTFFSQILAPGGSGGAAAGSGDSGGPGSSGNIWIAARAYDGNLYSQTSSVFKIYEIHGKPGSFTLISRAVTDSWNNL